MKFYIKPTQEHPNEKGEYALIQEGTLCLFTGKSYEETANEEKFKIAFNTLSSQQKEQDIIECEIDDKFKFKSLKIELQDTDSYETNPINETDKQKGTIKPCLFEKIPCPLRFKKKKSGILIGLIKAYKQDKNKEFINDISSLNNPHNEIYTIDIEQEIQLRAFVYEGQKVYGAKNEIKDKNTQTERDHALKQGNITKIIKNANNAETQKIKWAFKLSNPHHLALKFKKDENGFMHLEKMGLNIEMTLKELLKDEKEVDKLVGETITLFAYNELVGINKNQSKNNKAYNIRDTALNKTRKEVKIGIDNAYAQYRVSHYKEDWSKRQIQAERISSITLKIIKTRFRLEFDGQSLQFLENERILGQWNARSKYTLKQREITINVTYDSDELDLKDIECMNKDELCHLFHQLEIDKDTKITLNIKPQKRILILIDRFKQTTQSTLARMNIYLDNKRVKQDGKIEKDKGIKPIDDENSPYAYILDRNGPDCIQSGINLRVPEGRYNVSWHNYGIRANTLQIYNNFVPFARSILIHNGHTPKDSEGCMLINDYVVDKFDDIVFEDKQENKNKEQRLKDSLIKDFTKEILGKRTNNIKDFVKKYVEVRIVNNFKEESNIIKINNKEGIHLFSIERKDIKKCKLSTRELYAIKGVQWFETSADNYHKLLYVNEKLKDRKECQKLGLLYFTWREVVEFAEISRSDSDFLSGGSGDWKASKNGAKDYLLVSMEGIPYWADAVGQIPFALHSYKTFLTKCDLSIDKVENSVIYWGNIFASGAILEALKNFFISIFVNIDDNAYDNVMIKRGIKFAHTKYKRIKQNIHSTEAKWLDSGKAYGCKWQIQDTKSNPQLLKFDFKGQEIL